ncbi:Ig-like domain-containing protein [Lysinibacillus sp. IITD104]|uniref:Ig-like domain-containing protein n=1 Tax=Lysinibacillus sp. IITD104 TaxID=3116650 RepID=UPI002FD24ED8
MKKGFKAVTAAALAISALTPVAAFAAENTVENGVYTTTNFYSLDAFKKLSGTAKAAALTSEGAVIVVAGKVYTGANVLSLNDTQLDASAVTVDAYNAANDNKLVSGQPIGGENQTGELKVESVNAINGKTAVVKFTQPVKESTVVTGGKLNATNVVFNTLEDPAQTITGASADAVLSEDGKTLTITPQTTEIFQGRYQVIINNVESTKSVKLPKYDEVLNLGKDKTAPTIVSVEKVNASASKVTFSEAIANLGTASEVTFTYKLADGTVVPSSDITVTPGTDNKSITVEAPTAKYAGKKITATVLGAKDHAGNLISPNPSTFEFQVGDKDGVAPTIASVKANSDTEIEVVFSEEVQGFNTANKADITLTGDAALLDGAVADTITQDKKDKKKYIIKLDKSALKAGVNSAVANLKIVKTNITDLSGEAMADDYTAIVTIKKDTVAPKHVSTKIIEEAGVQWLVLGFDEELHATVGTAVAPVVGSATSFKDYVTVNNKNITLGASVALTEDKKGIKAKLSEVQFDAAALKDGTEYTFKVEATDAANNKSDAISVNFTYNAAANSDKPALVTPVSITGTGQDTITLEFDKELDGASATNVANYKIAGLTVEKAVLSPVTAGKQSVTLTIGKNEQSGARAISISGVKSKAGVAMDEFNDVVNLTENVKPTVTAAKVIETDKIEITFSENVEITGGANEFGIFIGDATTTAAHTTAAVASPGAKKVVVTLTTELTEADLAKTITVKKGSTNTVKDVAGNDLDFKDIIVTK